MLQGRMDQRRVAPGGLQAGRAQDLAPVALPPEGPRGARRRLRQRRGELDVPVLEDGQRHGHDGCTRGEQLLAAAGDGGGDADAPAGGGAGAVDAGHAAPEGDREAPREVAEEDAEAAGDVAVGLALCGGGVARREVRGVAAAAAAGEGAGED